MRHTDDNASPLPVLHLPDRLRHGPCRPVHERQPRAYTGSTRGTDYLQLDGEVPLSPRWNLRLHAGCTHYATNLAVSLANGARDPSYVDLALAAGYALNRRWTLAATLSHSSNAAFYAHVASFRDPTVTKDLGGTRSFLTLSATL